MRKIMAGFEVKSTEELLSFKESNTIHVGDIIIHKCQTCGRWVLRKYRRVSNKNKDEYFSLNCQKCKTELKHLRIWGTKYPFKDPVFREKFLYKGMERKYGKGIKHAHQVPELHQKAYDTTCKRFNSDHPFSSPKMISKYKKGNIEKYGVEWPLQSPEVRKKANDKMLELYGTENLFYSKEFQESVKQHWKNKYGVENPSQVPEIQKKVREIINKLYNGHTPSVRYNYYGVFFDSSWELAVWIYCIDNNIPIIREPVIFEFVDILNRSKYYVPDLMIDGKLVEIKGSQFFNSDGTMRFPYTKLHHDSKELTYEEKSYYNDLYERKHQCGLANGVEFWKESDCKKYIDYCNTKYPNWNNIFRKDIFYNPSYWCFNLVPNGMIQLQYFIPISQQGINPYDIDKDEKYHFVKDKGLTPFDIK